MKSGYLMKWVLLMIGFAFVLSISAAQADGAVAEVTIGGKPIEYVKFADAVSAWEGATQPATLTLLANCSISEDSIELKGNVCKTLELNGFTLQLKQTGIMKNPVIVHECPLDVYGPGTIDGDHGIGVKGNLAIIGDVNFKYTLSALAYHSSRSGRIDLTQAEIEEWKVYYTNGEDAKINVKERLILKDGYVFYVGEQAVTELARHKSGVIKKTASAPVTIAQVNGTDYSAIGEALSAWEASGGTLALMDNAAGGSLNITLSAGKEYTFQGGAYTLALGDRPLAVNGTLNIVSGSIQGVLACNGGSINVEGDIGARLAIKNTDPQGRESDIDLPNGYCLMSAPDNGQYVEQLRFGDTAWVVKHTHSAESLEADEAENTITESCACGYELGRFVLTVPEEAVYSGSQHEATVAAQGSLMGADYSLSYITADGKAPVHAGQYTVTLATEGVSITAEYAIDPAKLTIVNVAIESVSYRAEGDYAFDADVFFAGAVNQESLVKGDDYTLAVKLTGRNHAGDVPLEITVTMSNDDYILDAHDTVNATVKIEPAGITQACIADIPEQSYTGMAIQPEIRVTVNDHELISGEDYTVAYSNNVNAGDAVIIVTGKGNYTGTVTKYFRIMPIQAVLEARADEDEYTYGETIKVTGRLEAAVDVPATSNSLTETVMLCNGTSVLATTQVENGGFSLEYDTEGKGILPDEAIVLTVYYDGGNMKEKSIALDTIQLNKAVLTVASVTAADRVYSPENEQVVIENILLAGKIAENDEVLVKLDGLTGSVEKADAGVYRKIMLPDELPLVGRHAGFYAAVGGEAAAEVEISKRLLTEVQAPEDMQMNEYCVTADAVIAMLPKKISCFDADGRCHERPISWVCADFNKTPEASSAFVWSVDLGSNFDGNEDIITGTILVQNGKAYAVEITAKDTDVVYTGNTYDVRELFTIDEMAGAATYVITGGEGAGTLEGTVLTITKAGGITIQVTTAAHTVEGLPYASGFAEATLTVRKGENNAYILPTGLTAVYGDVLRDIALPAGWTWKTPENKAGNAGEQSHPAIFNSDPALWNDLITDLRIQVAKAEPHYEGTPYLGKIEQGTLVTDISSEPIAVLFNVPGTVVWEVPDGMEVEPGKSYTWSFLPEESDNYESVSGQIVLLPESVPTVTPTPTPEMTPTPTPVVTSAPVQRPTVLQPEKPMLLSAGEESQITMMVMALDATHYQWYVDKGTGYVPIIGENGPSLTISVEAGSDGNQYFCRVSNAGGTIDSPVFTLTVLPEVDVPLTGDSAHPGLWMMLMLLSAVALLRRCSYRVQR